MKISVKVKDIKLEVNDCDNSAVIKYKTNNKEVQKTLKIMCEEALKLLKERNM